MGLRKFLPHRHRWVTVRRESARWHEVWQCKFCGQYVVITDDTPLNEAEGEAHV